jgi:hypothetical protein
VVSASKSGAVSPILSMCPSFIEPSRQV